MLTIAGGIILGGLGLVVGFFALCFVIGLVRFLFAIFTTGSVPL